MPVSGVLVTYVNGWAHHSRTISKMDLEKLLQKIIVTINGATLNILKEDEFIVESLHSLDNTDLKEISKCAPFIIDVHHSFLNAKCTYMKHFGFK
jgi:hypothetical protein